MSICSVCRGRGRWQESTHSWAIVAPTEEKARIIMDYIKDGTIEFVWRECLACNMTGLDQDPEQGEDFDIGGSSYADNE